MVSLLPLDYTALYECLCTYAAKLWTKFGELCQHYIKVEDIIRVMEFHPIKDTRQDFSALLCAQIIWVVIEDLRQFFYTNLHPDSFVGGAMPLFPTSMLAWVNQYMSTQASLPTTTCFPQRWAVAAATRNQTRMQLLPVPANMGATWQGATGAMWEDQQPPPSPLHFSRSCNQQSLRLISISFCLFLFHLHPQLQLEVEEVAAAGAAVD